MKIINGKKIADQVLETLEQKIRSLELKPGLAIIQIGFDKPTEIYIQKKIQDAKQVGIKTEVHSFKKTSINELQKLCTILNKRRDIHGYFIQLPFSLDKNKFDIFRKITIQKDVDGLNPLSLGLLFQKNKRKHFVPATVKAIELCLKHVVVYSDDKYSDEELNEEFVTKELKDFLKGKNITIINDSIIVGRPLAALLLNYNSSISICHKYTANLTEYTKKSDIIITATGHPHLIKADMIKPNSILIDVGISYTNRSIKGDIDFNSLKDMDGWITPVPGGVGPITRAMLLQNTFNAYLNQIEKH
ncbi:hypothetical protein GF362_00410 [Candidatus Dojkabacteria bacterium]|nr:hypothetical protein [Candidatus Dojkabacteria bacterium]